MSDSVQPLNNAYLTIKASKAGQQTFHCVTCIWEWLWYLESTLPANRTRWILMKNEVTWATNRNIFSRSPCSKARGLPPPWLIRRLIRHNFSKFGYLISQLTESWKPQLRKEAGCWCGPGSIRKWWVTRCSRGRAGKAATIRHNTPALPSILPGCPWALSTMWVVITTRRPRQQENIQLYLT